MLADRALLQTVRFGELTNRLAVFPRAQPEHQLLPHGFRQRLAAMEHLVAAQPHFLVLRRPHARPLDRHLLPHHHAVAALATPPIGRPFRLPLTALADQFPDFFLHQQIHQLQAGLTNQFAHALTQPAHHLSHGQHHLHRRISIRGHCLELLHSSLRFNLVWFLHSDSLFFSAKENCSEPIRLRSVRVATFQQHSTPDQCQEPGLLHERYLVAPFGLMVHVQELLSLLFSLPVRRLIADHDDVGNVAHPRLHDRACLSSELLGSCAAHRKAACKHDALAG